MGDPREAQDSGLTSRSEIGRIEFQRTKQALNIRVLERRIGGDRPQDTGLLGSNTKHIYFSGPRKKFRVRYDRIVDFEPFSDGFGLMRGAQTAKPQSFRTGDGWFAYNLAVNLAQM